MISADPQRLAAAHSESINFQPGLRVLYLGENWYGSCARACCASLRRLGCHVQDVNAQTTFPQLRRRASRAALRFFSRALVREYNELVLDTADWFKPDLLLAFKGNYLKASTIKTLRQSGIPTYNYYPDPSPFGYHSTFPDAMFQYDCVFYTKLYWEKELFLEKFRARAFVPHGYDPEIHTLHTLHPDDVADYGHDVTVVGTYSAHKEKLLDSLLALMPSIDLAVWGSGWTESCHSARVIPTIQGHAVTGTTYAKVLNAACINLAIVEGIIYRGVRQYDETTTRTFEIPACGGFMLHERSRELLSLFREDKEVVCFDSLDELANKIAYYLAHPGERRSIARAGYERCVPAYSFDTRMAKILAWHKQFSDRNN